MACSWKCTKKKRCAQFLSNKLVGIITGLAQLALWVIALLNLILQPMEIKKIVHRMDSASLLISIALLLVIIIMSILLLVGIFKDSVIYVITYLVFNVLLTIFFVVTILYQLITRVRTLGDKGVLGEFLIILLNVLFFFVIGNYLVTLKTLSNNKANRKNPA